MIKVGTDIVSVDRIQKSIDRFGNRFLTKFLNPLEIPVAPKTASIAGLWASKEAISKALGCGIGSKLGFYDITIYKDNSGAPYFVLSDRAKERFDIVSSSLSISHDGGFAIAVVVLELKNA